MNSYVERERPEEIFDELKNKISDLVEKITNNEDSLDLEMIGDHFSKSKQILLFQQTAIEKEIDNLKKNAEWEFFTVAFFGETNAGKSTLIEVLRILFGEETKKQIQKKFLEIKNKNNLDENDFDNLQIQQGEASKEINLIKEQIKKIENEHQDERHKLIEQLSFIEKVGNDKVLLKQSECKNALQPFSSKKDELQSCIDYKKKNMPWWLKIIYIFKRLDEEKQLIDVNLDIVKYESKFNSEISEIKRDIQQECLFAQSEVDSLNKKIELKCESHQSKLSDVYENKSKIEIRINKFKELLKELDDYEDGNIIGDGRSDHTRLSTEFIFDLNGTKVKLIDVPGIEGKEHLVADEISKAVKKAHAVFYVTSKDAPPNEGTLAKIKQHLAAQTEIWTIYNKPATSPRVLKGELIKSADERKALDGLNELMNNALGKNYKNDVVIAGLPAFFAVSSCLIPFSEKYSNQKKFLSTFDQDELLDKSGLKNFEKILKNDVVGDIEFKIKSSNFNKANHEVKDTISKLSQISLDLSEMRNNVEKQLVVTRQEIEGDYIELESQLKNAISDIIVKFQTQTRQEVYSEIEANISNDDFKKVLKNTIENNAGILEGNLLKEFQSKIKNFDKNVQDRLKKLSSRLAIVEKNFKSDKLKGFDQSFDLNFDLNSAVNKVGLISAGLGTAAAMWWNPVGWIAISLTAAGLIFSFAKAIWSFFDSEFKKSEQKKSVDKNLSSIIKEINNTTDTGLKTVIENIEPILKDLKIKLNQPANSINALINDIDRSIISFKEISNNISASYGAN